MTRPHPLASARASYARNTHLARLGPDERRANTEPARQAAREARYRRLEDQVDPDRVLDPDDRAARVQSLIKAEMARLTALSLEARAAKKVSA